MPSRSNEVLIAVLGLIGVVATGAFSNWEKLFGKNPIVQAAYTGYRPTGEFETELRYYLDISGARTMTNTMMKNVIEMQKAQLLSQFPSEAATINEIFDVASQEMPKFDDFITALLPVYQKYYTLEQIQELNKFYSTEAMRQMVKQGPLIAQDTVPISNKMIADLQARISARLKQQATKPQTPSPN